MGPVASLRVAAAELHTASFRAAHLTRFSWHQRWGVPAAMGKSPWKWPSKCWFSHKKWWISITMLDYQRVTIKMAMLTWKTWKHNWNNGGMLMVPRVLHGFKIYPHPTDNLTSPGIQPIMSLFVRQKEIVCWQQKLSYIAYDTWDIFNNF